MIVAPSLLSADFSNLEKDVKMVNESDATWLHMDVMDGVFVPNISFGFPVIEAVSRISTKPLDVHLMIVDPGRYVDRVRDCGAHIMNVHYEACTHLNRTVMAIREAGMQAAVTLNPATPVCVLEDILPFVDMVLVMSVNPGFGGQKFIANIPQKVQRLKKMIQHQGLNTIIEVDGGVNLETGKLLAQAGADALVAGNAVFKSANPKLEIQRLSQL